MRMPFRSIVAEPHQLAKLADAFDAAWMGVNWPAAGSVDAQLS
jgi:hypothetical protein